MSTETQMISQQSSISGTERVKEKTSIRELEDYLDSLKSEIKTWEHHFKSENEGRMPTSRDIRSNKVIAAKYKKYQKYKDRLALIKERKSRHKLEKDKHKKNLKSKVIDNDGYKDTDSNKENYFDNVSEQEEFDLRKEKEEEEEEKEEKEILADEIGPTPQLNGRVLSIFDINVKMTPESLQQQTPSKNKGNKEVLIVDSPLSQKRTQDIVRLEVESTQREIDIKTPSKKMKINDEIDDFKTPTGNRVQRKLLFSPSGTKPIMTPRRAPLFVQETPKYLRSESQSGNLEMLFELSPEKTENKPESPTDMITTPAVTTTPTKMMTPDALLFETPKVNNNVNMSPSKVTEPSPFMATRRKGKSLFQLSQDLKQIIKERNQWIDHEDEDIKKLIENENKEFWQEGGEEEENKEDVGGVDERKRKKAKTNKRSTRRSKVTSNPDVENIDDDYKLNDIRNKINEIQGVVTSRNKMGNGVVGGELDEIDEEDELELIDVVDSEDDYKNSSDESGDGINSDSEEEDEDDEDDEKEVERVRRREIQLKQGVSNSVSNNYVKLKINNKKKGKYFKKR